MAYLEAMRIARAPATLREYHKAFALFADFLVASGKGAATIADLSHDVLAGFYDWLARGRHGKARALDTRRRLVEKVEKMWAWLFSQEWHASVPRPKELEMQREEQKAVLAPTWDEMAACVRACFSEAPRRFCTVLYYTGLRASQVDALSWGDVDMDRGLLTLAPHKRSPGRIIPLSPHLLKELQRWGKREGKLVAWGVTRQVRERRVREAWKASGVRDAVWKGRPDHAFRRGLTSGLAELGADERLAELYVGHAVRGARRHYLDPAALIKPFRAIAALIPKLGSGKVAQLARRRS